ncbi:flavin reductase [Micromonospora peucetia]|uniref:flavin reductase n=1 Tax=Micromonospora peucetia TaxID=47871 RepID=UPI00332411EA
MTRRREHVPSHPIWRCAACGIAWPCSAAKLRLLGEYRTDRIALLLHLATLQTEAAAHFPELDTSRPRPDLTDRFTT